MTELPHRTVQVRHVEARASWVPMATTEGQGRLEVDEPLLEMLADGLDQEPQTR